jgi:hypothetical protein
MVRWRMRNYFVAIVGCFLDDGGASRVAPAVDCKAALGFQRRGSPRGVCGVGPILRTTRNLRVEAVRLSLMPHQFLLPIYSMYGI